MKLAPVLIGVVAVAVVAGGIYKFGGMTGGGQSGGTLLALADTAPLATPPGVTYATAKTGGTVLLATAGIQIPAMATAYADPTGKTRYTSDKDDQPGKSACDAECAKTWVPLAAPADAQPSGYWDVATRDDGSRQWTYRGFAVYSYSGDKKPGDMLGNDIYDIMAGNDPFIMADLGVKGMGAFFWHTAAP